MMKQILVTCLCLVSFGLLSCAGEGSIFPSVVMETSESAVVLPNPISMVVDEANSQILVANSNVDILYSGGSLAVLSVDATDTASPALSAVAYIETPNFACEMYDDGAGSVYVPYREESSSGSNVDQIIKYSLGASSISSVTVTTIASDPFGMTGSGSDLYVVSDDVLTILDTDLSATTTVDLTVAEDSLIDYTDSTSVEGVAVDPIRNRLVISNRSGYMFVVNLDDDSVVQVLSGPTETRDILIDDDKLYVLDGITEAVWIFDMNALSTASGGLVSVDDATFLIHTVSVGNNPNGLTVDATNHRMYVANSDDDTVSVIDTLTYQEVARVSLDQDDISSSFLRDGVYPTSLKIGTFNSTTYLFVACFSSHDVIMINTDTLGVVEVFPNTEL